MICLGVRQRERNTFKLGRSFLSGVFSVIEEEFTNNPRRIHFSQEVEKYGWESGSPSPRIPFSGCDLTGA